MYRLLVLPILIVMACGTPPPKGKILWIGPELKECSGEGPMKCMLVKEHEDGEWQYFYNNIAGFDYEEGYTYKVLVQVDTVENPPAGGSSLKYSLIDLIEKTKTEMATPAEPNYGDLYSHPWRLKLYILDGDVVTLSIDQEVLLDMTPDGRVSGKSACNNYTGQVQVDGNNVKFSALASTRKMCVDEEWMKLEATYLKLLESAASISPVKSRYLNIICSDGSELKFLPKPEEN